MSPWKLASGFPAAGEVASLRYKELALQNSKRGPTRPIQEQLTASISKESSPFAEKSLLIAPALLVQKRQKSGTCESPLSEWVVEQYFEIGRRYHCSEPRTCDGYTRDTIYKCPVGDSDGRFYGRDPQQRQAFYGAEENVYI